MIGFHKEEDMIPISKARQSGSTSPTKITESSDPSCPVSPSSVYTKASNRGSRVGGNVLEEQAEQARENGKYV